MSGYISLRGLRQGTMGQIPLYIAPIGELEYPIQHWVKPNMVMLSCEATLDPLFDVSHITTHIF